MAKPTTQDEKKVVPPPAEGEPKPATGSAAEAAVKKDEKPEAVEEKEEELPPKEVAYTENVTQVVPAPNPAYKEPSEPPFGSKRLKDEQAAGKKALDSIESNKELLQPKKPAPAPAPAAASAPKK